MEGLNLFLIFVTIFLLQNGVISQDHIPPLGDLGASGAKLERKQPLTQLLELKSYLESLFGSVSAMDTKLKSIKKLLTATDELVTHLGANSIIGYLYPRYYKISGTDKDLKMVLSYPKATFFTGEDLAGEAVNYDSNTTLKGGCHRADGIKSMRISESCVRVFKYNQCSGISRAIYRKPNSRSFINFLTPELDYAKSIGPCLPNEFQFATVYRIGSRIAIKKDESNVRQVPDFVDVEGFITFYSKSTPTSSSTNPVTHYYMDHRRPKWIRAMINERHLKNSTGSTSGVNMAILPELGGPRNRAFNTFKQTRKNFEEWKRITDEVVVAALKQSSTKWVVVYVTFVYATSSAPSPYGFYYFINADDRKIVYGFIEN